MTAPPLTLAYWEALRRLADPLELMKFTLIWDGDLPSAGNKSKAEEASIIRNAFHHQLADLWDSHVVFRQLARTARTIAGLSHSMPARDQFGRHLNYQIGTIQFHLCGKDKRIFALQSPSPAWAASFR